MTTSFSTPGLKTVDLRLTETCVGTTRLVCGGVAWSLSIDVRQAPTATDTAAPHVLAVRCRGRSRTGPTTPVNYTFQATDPDDAVVSRALAAPAPGTAFPVGTSTVTCSATDSHGNVGTQGFDIVITDTTGPAVTVPGMTTAEATSPDGAPVGFAVTANDLVDGPLVRRARRHLARCSPWARRRLVTATDAHGNVSTAGFPVNVASAGDQLGAVHDKVATFHLRNRKLLTRIDGTIGAVGRSNLRC